MAEKRFDRVVGTGGIGSGVIFQMDSDRALSRDESRMADLSPARDYCKQHIILHYIARVMGDRASVHAIGAVGEDAVGTNLLSMMGENGINCDFVRKTPELPTLYSVCLQYPDMAICNVTSKNSASASLDENDIKGALEALSPALDEKTIVLAAPEVPLPARLKLLEMAKAKGAFTVASCTQEEVPEFERLGGVTHTDLLCINEEEAQAFLGQKARDRDELAALCHQKQRRSNPVSSLLITLGKAGSLALSGEEKQLIPAFPAKVLGTGGAGDAYVSGVIIGLLTGLPYLSVNGQVSSALLGAFLASESVKSPDTIAMHIDRELVDAWLLTQKKEARV